MAEDIQWPIKTREMHNNHFDSTVWNDFPFRDDDIIIATNLKSGTTWVQQIVSQLLFNGEEGLPVADMSPWAGSPYSAQGGETPRGGEADPQAVPEDPPAD